MMTKSELTILQQELDVALDRFQRTLRERLKPPVPDAPTQIIPKTIPPTQSPIDKTNQEQSTKPRMLHLVARLLQYFKRKYASIKQWLSRSKTSHE